MWRVHSCAASFKRSIQNNAKNVARQSRDRIHQKLFSECPFQEKLADGKQSNHTQNNLETAQELPLQDKASSKVSFETAFLWGTANTSACVRWDCHFTAPVLAIMGTNLALVCFKGFNSCFDTSTAALELSYYSKEIIWYACCCQPLHVCDPDSYGQPAATSGAATHTCLPLTTTCLYVQEGFGGLVRGFYFTGGLWWGKKILECTPHPHT